ncbi:MAG: 50S ribosomal protein L18 [Nonlabens sp.]|uniref:50S ribosomal protein L18 n=1 Tax=Nonlabens sp. TaxID=1888209 RepID=UPI003EF985AC
MAFSKSERRSKIRRRIRKTVSGTALRPRLSVYRSNKEIYAQVINDVDGLTIASASSKDIDAKGEKVAIAKEVGRIVAEKAKSAGIDTVSFDRGGYLYHGRVLSLAEGAREAGLNF